MDLPFVQRFRSVFHLTQLCVPHLIKTKGSIVNVSSVNGQRSVGIQLHFLFFFYCMMLRTLALCLTTCSSLACWLTACPSLPSTSSHVVPHLVSKLLFSSCCMFHILNIAEFNFNRNEFISELASQHVRVNSVWWVASQAFVLTSYLELNIWEVTGFAAFDSPCQPWRHRHRSPQKSRTRWAAV